MKATYRGKYPRRICTVSGQQSPLGLGVRVTLNNGDGLMVRPISAHGRRTMPRVGSDIGDYGPSDYTVSPVIAEIPAPHVAPQNCHGQSLPVDARGWPAGTEKWEVRS